jgi:DNA/RNA-binding domain of Phe-tRNA-synthetase-like protein
VTAADAVTLSRWLADTWVDPRVRDAHPDYVAVLVAASGLRPGPTSAASEAALREAETVAAERLEGQAPHDLPEVMAWRHAYQGFGVKPREARSSIESLLRRTAQGFRGSTG